MSELKVNKVSPRSGTAFTLGDSGDTFTVPTGASLVATDELKTNKISPASGTAFTFGDSGDTFTIPSGATIANSGTATGFGGGKINQVVQTVVDDVKTSTSTSYADFDLNVDITPSATSSKIMIFVSGVGGNDASHTRVTTGLHRDSTLLKECSFYTVQDDALVPITWSYLDSPSSTSQITYALKFKNDNSGGTVTLNRSFNNSTDFGTTMITAMEVLA